MLILAILLIEVIEFHIHGFLMRLSRADLVEIFGLRASGCFEYRSLTTASCIVTQASIAASR